MPDREIVGVTVQSAGFNIMMLAIGIGMIALGVIFPDPPDDFWVSMGLRVFTIFCGVVALVFTPRYYISFRYDALVITVGFLNIIKVRLDRKKISHVGPREWIPLKDFGGSGIKGGFGEFAGYMCFNIFSGSGIEIKTTEKNYVIEMNELDRNRVLAMIGEYGQAKEKSAG